MKIYPARIHRDTALAWLCVFLLLCLAACQNGARESTTERVEQIKATQQPTQVDMKIPQQKSSITPTPTATTAAATPTPTSQPQSQVASSNANSSGRPVLAFYYPWYTQSTWCSCKMSDLPPVQYNSDDDATIERQITSAANVGITGFISSWWGPGHETDTNFVKLLAHASALESRSGYHFASSIYFESDSPGLNGSANIINGLRYLINHYGSDPHFFHWQGKPVFFFWDPLGAGRTLNEWADIRSQVDPNNQTIWSAEGVDTTMLSVFDGIHLFSAGYWGIQHNTMDAVDQGFRAKVDAYNSAHQSSKIWAAGVSPGYDDTRVPGRSGTFIVPRNNGTTYTTSWNAAITSNPSWVTVTSYNEWFEGSMIEPGVTYGNLYLTLTQQFTQKWHG